MSRVVVKVGSNVLTREDGTIDVTRMSAIVDQIVWLRKKGFEIILISSGAVACGRSMIKAKTKLDSVQQRQLFSSVGQVRLMELYYNLFRDYGISVGQVLTMKESFSTRREYLNQRSCMEVMLQNKVVPIVNENDTVSVTELMFTDNDELSGLVASMMDARTLIILSNVDGIYDGVPGKDGSKVIRTITASDDVSCFIGAQKSGFGRGGMLTKCSIARKVAEEGIRVMIANGKKEGILQDLLLHPQETMHTEFLPEKEAVNSVKKWIAHSSGFAKGIISVDANAERALLKSTAASLLMVGVTAVTGEFEEGDIVGIHNAEGKAIALGKTSYSSAEAKANIGIHDIRPIIHYDYLFIL